MKQIILDDFDIIKTKESSSKGNQPKVKIDGLWYKKDHMGYEALAEVVISKLLGKSNVSNFVKYSPIKILKNNIEYNGCYSKDFLDKNQSEYTAEKLYRSAFGNSLSEILDANMSTEDKISKTVNNLEHITNLSNIGRYVAILMELDAFFLNEDRHTNNITFLRDDITGEFYFSPYFDFGLSLLSDINDYPLNIRTWINCENVKSKPFSFDFSKQVNAVHKLYGSFVKFYFTEQDVDEIVDSLKDYYEDAILNRVKEVLKSQIKKYDYMFSND